MLAIQRPRQLPLPSPQSQSISSPSPIEQQWPLLVSAQHFYIYNLMLARLTHSLLAPFSMKLRGPTAQRLELSKPIRQKTERHEDYFKQYYPQTSAFYKNGFEERDLKSSNQMVKRAFSLENATPSEILKYRIEQAVKKYQRNLLDHGSAAVQFAVATEKVIFMMNHTKKYPKETKGARALVRLIQQRRNMMDYCMRTDYHRYRWVCADYGIPDVHPKNAHHKTSMFRNNSWSGY